MAGAPRLINRSGVEEDRFMALLFIDGFSGQDVTYKYDFGSSGAYTATTGGSSRIAGGYYGSGSAGNYNKTITASTRVFAGIGYQPGINLMISFFGDTGVTQHITVRRNSGTGRIEIRRGNEAGTLLATGTTTLLSGVWNYIEASCTISDTVGEVHVRLNGSPTDEVSYTGDTKNGGTATTIDKVMFGNEGNSSLAGNLVADFYIANDTGSAPNNNFLGDVVVRTLVPSGNGNSSQLLGSDGNSVNNYQLVDERPSSSSDYVGSPTSGQKDTYAMADLPAGVTNVYGMQINGTMAKSDASVAQSRLLLRSSGTDYNGTTRTLNTTFQAYYEFYETDPATGVAWTSSGVNNMETGMEVL